jgi:hypothetical protein
MMKGRRPMQLFLLALSTALLAGDDPASDAFRVRRTAPAPGPRITTYLEYQVSLAWQQDEARQSELAGIRTEADLLKLQARLRRSLLDSIGGLPQEKTPLNPWIAGTIPLAGYRIEKVVFESLPKFYVTALLYLPDGSARRPAVLVACGHTTNGKIGYQYLCHRLAKRGYVVLCWDPVGQGERSQFWDAAASKSRYNLVCGEHAVLGNLAYLAGTNLARWEIWDGVRAVDYLLTRPEVDPERISITGTSGGGFQSSHIGALDGRIKVVVPSCYISALPMRMSNRIFQDPDSDPEQDLFGMVSNGVDHPGLLLLCYPRPVFVAAAVEDFFPIEGTRKTLREVSAVYRRMGHPDRIGHVEGYHGHKFSPENIEAAFAFLDRFNGMPAGRPFPAEEKLEDKALWCTRTGQVSTQFKDSRSLMDFIRDYWAERRGRISQDLAQIYREAVYPGIAEWPVVPFRGTASPREIAWESTGSSAVDGLVVERYLLHHSEGLSIPLLYVHATGREAGKSLLWFGASGKAGPSDWPEIKELVGRDYQVFSFDFRGLGEDRMLYKVGSADDPKLAPADSDLAYLSPLSGVLANYVYNSLLTGRPYFLQMIEDAEITARFAREKSKAEQVQVTARGEAYTLACAIAEAVPGVGLFSQPGEKRTLWSELVDQKRELWPIQYLLPGGAYIR